MKNYTLITGATSGIGLELAELFAKDKNNLVLVARGTDKLKEIKDNYEKNYGINIEIISADLSDLNAPENIYKILKEKQISIDNLVNNAGFASFGLFNEIDKEVDLGMLKVNVFALTHLIKLFLPDMVKNKKGRILNIASTAAFQPGPLMAVYYASKAYVLYLSEALASELEGTGVTVTALCPGPTKTGFQQRAKMEKSKLIKSNVMDAKAVSKTGYDALMNGKTFVVPGFKNKMLVVWELFCIFVTIIEICLKRSYSTLLHIFPQEDSHNTYISR